ncbi:MAG TPA: hypothetical protein EYO76_10400 [Flavobacteriaceae bacterium]|nr:hypothetical protein [Flavobacteriaceae bacterium]
MNEHVSKSNLLDKNDFFECPKDGICSFEVLKNKLIKLKKDEFGIPYIELDKSSTTDLLKFSYKRNPIEGVEDSSYEEIIYIDVKNIKKSISLKNEELSTVNAIFGRLCFCRGSSGYFPIQEGNLSIKKISKNTYKIDFNFKINGVPQEITFFSDTFNL